MNWISSCYPISLLLCFLHPTLNGKQHLISFPLRSDQTASSTSLPSHTSCIMATTTNVVLNPPNLGFLTPKPLHLTLPHPNLKTKIKLQSLSMSRPTHLKVPQNSLTPTEESRSSSLQHDLLIVGPGVLGRLVAHKWQQVISHFLIITSIIYVECCDCEFCFSLCNLFMIYWQWHYYKWLFYLCQYACRKFRVVKFMDRQWLLIITMSWFRWVLIHLWNGQKLLTNFQMSYIVLLHPGPMTMLIMLGNKSWYSFHILYTI